MSDFLTAFSNNTNRTYTENGAVAKETTGSSLLDFFSQGGALRSRQEREIESIFNRAFAEDKLLALRTAFYIRDARGGQGERRTFRVILRHLAERNPDVIRKNINLIPFYGRWDDIYALFDTKLEKLAGELIYTQLLADLNSDFPSLMAKWLKSENASSAETKRLAKKTRKLLNMTPKQYRKMLSALRKRIGVVEQKMSAQNWKDIDYSKLPSKAAMIYRNAFMNHDEARYQAYLDSLEKGETKVNAGTLFPYELVREAERDIVSDYWFEDNSERLQPHERTLINEMWKALPDYIGNKKENSIAVVDTSGSMSGLPMQVAISVGMYLAERNSGPYKDHFITFSNRPQLVKIQGTDFVDKVANMRDADWEMNTNIEAVFDLILETAIQNNLSQDDIPQKLYIISDMEFDQSVRSSNGYGAIEKTLFQKIRDRFETKGFKMPELVFWNVDSRSDMSPMSMDERGFQLVSGCSPSIFEATMKGEFLSAYDLMLKVINSERYQKIKI